VNDNPANAIDPSGNEGILDALTQPLQEVVKLRVWGEGVAAWAAHGGDANATHPRPGLTTFHFPPTSCQLLDLATALVIVSNGLLSVAAFVII